MRDPNPLAGTRPPAAPPSLRSLVLEALESHLPIDAPDGWERIWSSRRLRFAWMITVLALLVLNLAPSPFGSKAQSSSPASRVTSQQSAEFAALGLQGPTLRRYENSTRRLSAGDQLELIDALRDNQ